MIRKGSLPCHSGQLPGGLAAASLTSACTVARLPPAAAAASSSASAATRRHSNAAAAAAPSTPSPSRAACVGCGRSARLETANSSVRTGYGKNCLHMNQRGFNNPVPPPSAPLPAGVGISTETFNRDFQKGLNSLYNPQVGLTCVCQRVTCAASPAAAAAATAAATSRCSAPRTCFARATAAPSPSRSALAAAAANAWGCGDFNRTLKIQQGFQLRSLPS
jgi:hypothetical protein